VGFRDTSEDSAILSRLHYWSLCFFPLGKNIMKIRDKSDMIKKNYQKEDNVKMTNDNSCFWHFLIDGLSI
jgi:hypothetical protein